MVDVDDHGLEVIKKAAEYVDPASPTKKKDYYLKVGGSPSGDPIPPIPVIGPVGTHFASENATTPGVEQSLLSMTVGAGIERDLYGAKVVTRVHGKFRVLLNGTLIGSGRTGPSIGDLSTFSWNPRLVLSASDEVEILFQSIAGTPISDVEAYFQASDRST